jgi:hypothetical protein
MKCILSLLAALRGRAYSITKAGDKAEDDLTASPHRCAASNRRTKTAS